MKICRYLMRDASSSDPASPSYGLIEGENVIEISGPLWAPWLRGSRSSRLADVRLLAPVEPSKIVCIGRNYAAHAAEMGNEVPKEPLMFQATFLHHRPGRSDRLDKIFPTRGTRRRTRPGYWPPLLAVAR